MPGIGDLVISSIFGNCGTRSPMFLRIAASSANAAGASERARIRAATTREDRFMTVFQESSARAVSQRLSGATRLTMDIPLLRSSRIGADDDERPGGTL